MEAWPGARRVAQGEATRPLTMGERALFAAGAPMGGVTVVLCDAGYRALA
jgi:hypothetical protein